MGKFETISIWCSDMFDVFMVKGSLVNATKNKRVKGEMT